ncbi:hypothetical protein [Halocatena halophila]|uniref:hypothetical protein n=1 Tax=Halocatena halophila TaxID=2814576 RepID=UPI002ED03F43
MAPQTDTDDGRGSRMMSDERGAIGAHDPFADDRRFGAGPPEPSVGIAYPSGSCAGE